MNYKITDSCVACGAASTNETLDKSPSVAAAAQRRRRHSHPDWRRIIPILCLAASVFSACKKSDDNTLPDNLLPDREYNCVELPLPYDVYSNAYYRYRTFEPQLNDLLSEKPIIDTIYLVPVAKDEWNNWHRIGNQGLPGLKEQLDEILNISPKRLRGRGAFEFYWGVGSEEDVKWFNKRGWEIRVKSSANND